MTGEGTYEWLTVLLTGEMRKAYPGFVKPGKSYGGFDKILENKKVAHLRGLLKNIVCKSDCPLAYMSPRVGMYVYNGCFYENVGEGAVFMTELIERVLERQWEDWAITEGIGRNGIDKEWALLIEDKEIDNY